MKPNNPSGLFIVLQFGSRVFEKIFNKESEIFARSALWNTKYLPTFARCLQLMKVLLLLLWSRESWQNKIASGLFLFVFCWSEMCICTTKGKLATLLQTAYLCQRLENKKSFLKGPLSFYSSFILATKIKIPTLK